RPRGTTRSVVGALTAARKGPIPQCCSTSSLKKIKHFFVNGETQQSSRIPTICAISRVVQKFRFHLIFGLRFGVIAAVTIWLVIALLLGTSSTWTHSTSLLVKFSFRSWIAFLGDIQIIPAFIGLMLCGSPVIYG